MEQVGEGSTLPVAWVVTCEEADTFCDEFSESRRGEVGRGGGGDEGVEVSQPTCSGNTEVVVDVWVAGGEGEVSGADGLRVTWHAGDGNTLATGYGSRPWTLPGALGDAVSEG